MKLFTQNSKMKKSSKGKYLVYDFALPAVKTCPYAGECKKFCYAQQGCYVFNVVKKKHMTNFKISKSEKFVQIATKELQALLKKASKEGKRLVLRWQSSGDIYSKQYFEKLIAIANQNKQVLFYTYTKSIPIVQEYSLPLNFRLIFSHGGTHDHLIGNNRHSRVFNTKAEARKNGYRIIGNNDLLAPISDRIGLVYHGNKKVDL